MEREDKEEMEKREVVMVWDGLVVLGEELVGLVEMKELAGLVE